MGFINKKSKSDRISENIEVLSLLYDKIDKCFHGNFVLEKIGGSVSECKYSTNANALENVERWKREFKAILAETLELLSKSWFRDEWIDTKINNLTEQYNQIRDILDYSKIEIK